MSMDGRYVTRSQGWRCDECPWMDSIPQGARKAMRLCPWMDGQIFAPAKYALPPSMAVVFRKEPGMAV